MADVALLPVLPETQPVPPETEDADMTLNETNPKEKQTRNSKKKPSNTLAKSTKKIIKTPPRNCNKTYCETAQALHASYGRDRTAHPSSRGTPNSDSNRSLLEATIQGESDWFCGNPGIDFVQAHYQTKIAWQHCHKDCENSKETKTQPLQAPTTWPPASPPDSEDSRHCLRGPQPRCLPARLLQCRPKYLPPPNTQGLLRRRGGRVDR
eukprot:scaffold6348_cov69-Attheya_sp.AAC.1